MVGKWSGRSIQRTLARVAAGPVEVHVTRTSKSSSRSSGISSNTSKFPPTGESGSSRSITARVERAYCVDSHTVPSTPSNHAPSQRAFAVHSNTGILRPFRILIDACSGSGAKYTHLSHFSLSATRRATGGGHSVSFHVAVPASASFSTLTEPLFGFSLDAHRLERPLPPPRGREGHSLQPRWLRGAPESHPVPRKCRTSPPSASCSHSTRCLFLIAP